MILATTYTLYTTVFCAVPNDISVAKTQEIWVFEFWVAKQQTTNTHTHACTHTLYAVHTGIPKDNTF